jgi:hypothetical protein
MGYISTMEIYDNKAEYSDIKKMVEELNISVGYDEFVVDGDNVFYTQEPTGNWRNTKNLAEIVSRYITSGTIEIEFIGEDGDRWGYEISPSKWVEYSYLDKKFYEVEDDKVDEVKELLDRRAAILKELSEVNKEIRKKL